MLQEDLKRYIGIETDLEWACDVVEAGAVRRYAQAIMDDDPDYGAGTADSNRFGGAVAPPLFPNHMFRVPFGAEDVLQARADDPDFDGLIPATQGLPPIEPLSAMAILNGGSEFEFFRYASHGEAVSVRQRYADIYEKESSKGRMVFVIIESEFRNANGDLLMRARRTQIRR